MSIYILNIMDLLTDNLGLIIGIASFLFGGGAMYSILRWLVFRNCTKPKIIIEYKHNTKLNPLRKAWELSIYNEKLTGLKGMLCKREEIGCWIEAEFSIGDSQSPWFTYWGYKPPNHTTLKPDSNRFTVELVSKLHNEKGFRLKEPTEFLRTVDYVSAIIVIKTGDDEIVKKLECNISDKGDDLDCECLDC